MSNTEFKQKIKDVIKHDLSFEPKSIWNYQINTTLDLIIEDDISKETIKQTIDDNWMQYGSGSFMSKFNTEYAKRIVEFWSREGDIILDPFAGRSRSLISALLGRKYIGFDVVTENIINMTQKYKNLSKQYNTSDIRLINDDSFNVDKYDIPMCDMIMTCPPYWNLEEYPDFSGQLSSITTYSDFLIRYRDILHKFSKYLKPGGFFVIVIANWRHNGKFIDFRSDTSNILKEKLLFYDEIILEMSPAKRHPLYPQAITKLKTFKTHEYALVFRNQSDTSEYQDVNDEINFSRPLMSELHNVETLFWKDKRDWINDIKFKQKKNVFF